MSADVCFSYRNGAEPGTLLPGRPQIFELLRERDLRPVVSIGAESAFHEGMVEAAELDGPEEHVRTIGGLALHEEVKVIVNRFDRTIKLDNLPPTINEGPIRSLGHYKMRAHEQVLSPLGIAMPTALVRNRDDIVRFAESVKEGDFFLKPEIGRFGKGAQSVGRSAVLAAFEENPDWYGKYLIQPAYDFTGRLPNGVRAYDKASAELFDTCDRSGKTKEIRMYGFHSRDSVATFPVARVVSGEDRWFFLDPDSVPAALHESTGAAMRRAAEVTGAAAVYGAVDYGYGSYDGQASGLVAIEMNLRSPYMMGYDKHPAVAHRLRTLFADQIAMTAFQYPGAPKADSLTRAW